MMPLTPSGLKMMGYLYWRHRNGAWAVRSGDWKLVSDVDGKEYLFNLARDLGETTGLTKAQPAMAARLRLAWTTGNAANATAIPWLAPGKSLWPSREQADTPRPSPAPAISAP